MQEHTPGFESFGAPDEDPQPPDPSPLYLSLAGHAQQSELSLGGLKLARFDYEEWRRPQDLLQDLTYEDASLLPGLFMGDEADKFFSYDTYTQLRFDVSQRTWRLTLTNIDGFSRSIRFDYDRPEQIEVCDSAIDEKTQVEYAYNNVTHTITPDHIDRLQREVQLVISWLDRRKNMLTRLRAEVVKLPQLPAAPPSPRKMGSRFFRIRHK
jgi:hypothetical protein